MPEYQYDPGRMEGYNRYRVPHAYYSYGPFRIITIIMVVVTLLLVTFGLACALMYVADLAEEFPSRARNVLRGLIVFNFTAHLLIMCVDHLSWWRSCISIVMNVLYLRVLRNFPFIPDFNHPLVIAVVMGVLVESAAWYTLAVRLMYYTSVWMIVAFYVMLWLVPIGLFTSCVPEEDRLPGAGSASMYSTQAGPGLGTPAAAAGSARRKKTIFNRVVGVFRTNEGV